MTKEIILSIKGLQTGVDEDAQGTEVIALADYYKKNDSHYVIYEEMMEGFRDITRNIIRFQDSYLEVFKRGLVNVRLIFEEHKKNITSYMTRLCREYGLSGGGITKLRKTASSDLQTSGTPKAIVASMLGHTTEVNEKYYTYDTSNLDQKKKIIQNRNVKFKELTPAG